MDDRRSLRVTSEVSGSRLDWFVHKHVPGLSRRELQSLFRGGHVRLNGRLASKGVLVQSGDEIEIEGLPTQAGPSADSGLALRIIYEDAHLVAVDKEAGMPSHALRSGERGTVVSGLLARYPEMRGVGFREHESGLLHRLDNDTSGVLLAARDQVMFDQLRTPHERGEFDKRYLALVAGRPEVGRVDAYLKADHRRVTVRALPFSGAKPISTDIISVAAFGDFSLLGIRVALAARHQVRAQLAALGHPIAGDAQYGGARLAGLGRHFLHASELTFPYAERQLTLRAPLPVELRRLLDALSEGASASQLERG